MNHVDSERLAAVWAIMCAAVFGAAILLTTGCSLDEMYVRADRQRHDVISPAHERYVEADEELSDEQKERRKRLLRAWEAQLEEAETRLAGE